MAWTATSAVPVGSSPAMPLANEPTWTPEPQNPSAPCVADIVSSTREASLGPSTATSVVSSSPAGPRVELV